MKVHQPNMPALEFEHNLLSKSKYAAFLVVKSSTPSSAASWTSFVKLGMDKYTLVF